jgi:hypothetical protein
MRATPANKSNHTVRFDLDMQRAALYFNRLIEPTGSNYLPPGPRMEACR